VSQSRDHHGGGCGNDPANSKDVGNPPTQSTGSFTNVELGFEI
jgi:hypothetical protein